MRAWVNALRPDGARLENCFVHYFATDERPIIANATHLRVNLEDPRVTSLLFGKDPADPVFTRDFAMLLLAAYGAMNFWVEEIGLEHELAFQRRVLSALNEGKLHALRPPAE